MNVFSAASLGLALACAGAAAQDRAPQFPPEQIKKGADLFARNCVTCHGTRMRNPQGGIDLRTFPRDARAVAGSAVPCIRLGAALDLLRLERVLRRRKLRKGEQRRGQDYLRAIQSGIRAKVQTDPPGSTLPSVSLFAEVPPPSPDSTLTY